MNKIKRPYKMILLIIHKSNTNNRIRMIGASVSKNIFSHAKQKY